MSEKKYTVDDILNDARRIRQQKQQSEQHTSMFQKIDRANYKKLRIGDTGSFSKLSPTKPIERQKGKFFQTMQLQAMKEEAIAALERNNHPLPQKNRTEKMIEEQKRIVDELVQKSYRNSTPPKNNPDHQHEDEFTRYQKEKAQQSFEFQRIPSETPTKSENEKLNQSMTSTLQHTPITHQHTKNISPVSGKTFEYKRTSVENAAQVDDILKDVSKIRSQNIPENIPQEEKKSLGFSFFRKFGKKNKNSAEKKLEENFQENAKQYSQQDFALDGETSQHTQITPEKTPPDSNATSHPKDLSKHTFSSELDRIGVDRNNFSKEAKQEDIQFETGQTEMFVERIITINTNGKKSTVTRPKKPSFKLNSEVFEKIEKAVSRTDEQILDAPADNSAAETTPADIAQTFEGSESVTDIKRRIAKEHMANLISTALLFLTAALSICISFADSYGFLSNIFPTVTENPLIYMMTRFSILFVSIAAASKWILKGFKDILKFNSSNDTLIAFASLGMTAALICYSFDTLALTSQNVNIYLSVLCLSLFFNLLAKSINSIRQMQNIRYALCTQPKNIIETIDDPEILTEVFKHYEVMEQSVMAAPIKCDRIENYEANSTEADLFDLHATLIAPIVFVGALVLGVIALLTYKNTAVAFTAFSLTTIIAAPFGAPLISAIPLMRIAARISDYGGFVLNYDAAVDSGNCNSIVLDARDLFPPASIILHTIKIAHNARIDDVLLDSASVICSVNGTLTDVFNQIIGHNTKILNTVDSVDYEENLGISAWIDQKRICIGNRTLLKNHNIAPPNKNSEINFKRDGREIVYLAANGTICAMFIVSYTANKQIQSCLRSLERRGIKVVVKTTDPNITTMKLSEIFKMPKSMFTIMPSNIHHKFDQRVKPARVRNAKVGFIGNKIALAKIIIGCRNAKNSITIATILQSIGITAASLAVVLFTLSKSLSQLSEMTILIYQTFWFLTTMIIVGFRKY